MTFKFLVDTQFQWFGSVGGCRAERFKLLVRLKLSTGQFFNNSAQFVKLLGGIAW